MEENNNNLQHEQCNLHIVSGSVFRCGFCGTPTDKDGNPMSLEYCNSLTDEQLNSAELVHGYCCYEEQQANYITVTRDMAIDAQDMSLEGQQWRW
jgi:hypothetical protein